MAAVKELLDSYIAEGKVDTKRIYVTGLSMGGMGHVRYRDALPEPVCRCHPDPVVEQICNVWQTLRARRLSVFIMAAPIA